MKFIFLVFAVFLFSTSSAQLTTNISWTQHSSMPASDIIYYDKAIKLVWKNFMGEPQNRGNVAALTVSGFGYNASVKTTNGKGILVITVYCYFDKNKSWVKPDRMTDYILTHEQHHLDVSYIAANAFIDKLRNTVFTLSNFNALLPRIYKENCDLMNGMQNDYDAQTRNGQIKEEQARWNGLIDEQISNLKD